ncbi:5'/3'-nucleotidase SurE [Halovenus salina]|uniref:5'-nucleotidase SurE n=1 Tax=Halovenus salina TaxID=1510225 RepID=A0ABD5W2V6_9EURY|nr:5'/3'-nucleotidase SurE [Halovenus salina]
MDDLDVLLTNDDGIEATGLQALYEELSEVADVTVVAPDSDQSAVGRAISHSVTVRDHERGYAIEGTPVDCVVAGLSTLVPETDIVVSGCNRGANLGHHTLGRSGTISAAVEAAFFGVPAIAVSTYVPADEFAYGTDFTEVEVPAHQYAEAVQAARFLLERTRDEPVFEHADYLNVNAPITDRATGEMALTRPAHTYRMNATREGDTVKLEDDIWEMMADGSVPDGAGTDRRAIMNNTVSVSPLTAPHTTEHHDELERLIGDYPPS